LEKIIVDGQIQTHAFLQNETSMPRPVVKLVTGSGFVIEMERPKARKLSDWLEIQLDSAIGVKIQLGVLTPDALSAACETLAGPVTLQFSPSAASQFVHQVSQVRSNPL
jgi:hypothetical protein